MEKLIFGGCVVVKQLPTVFFYEKFPSCPDNCGKSSFCALYADFPILSAIHMCKGKKKHT